MTTVIGMDIGGTHSRGRLVHDGRIVTESSVGSASLTAAGREHAGIAMGELLHQLRLDSAGPIDAICVGSAGSGSAEARRFLTEILTPVVTPPGRVLVVNDARLVLPTAGQDEGIALISGTGSTALGLTEGREVRVGGWGYLLGDEGSGYWIVRSAVRELSDRRDRDVSLGELGDLLLSATDTRDVAAMTQLFYDHPNPDRWARYANDVLDCADSVAHTILDQAASQLCLLVETATQRLAGRPDLPVVLAGGLLTGCPRLLDTVQSKLNAVLPSASLLVVTNPPVAGAVRLAEALAQTALSGSTN